MLLEFESVCKVRTKNFGTKIKYKICTQCRVHLRVNLHSDILRSEGIPHIPGITKGLPLPG